MIERDRVALSDVRVLVGIHHCERISDDCDQSVTLVSNLIDTIKEFADVIRVLEAGERENFEAVTSARSPSQRGGARGWICRVEPTGRFQFHGTRGENWQVVEAT